MAILVLNDPCITLPKRILKRFKGKQLEILETDEGILLKPVENAIQEARGILKGSRFNKKTYFEQKQLSKELER